jgi:hypothetical protein
VATMSHGEINTPMLNEEESFIELGLGVFFEE